MFTAQCPGRRLVDALASTGSWPGVNTAVGTDLVRRGQLMTNSHNPSGPPPPAGGPSAGVAPGAPGAAANFDPVAVIRSKPYLAALIFAAILGIPVSAIAYGFLALVAKIQHYVFDDLPTQVTGGPA